MCTGNSMSNHPIFLDVDTLTSQILFIFSLFLDNVEMNNPWKFKSSTPYSSKFIEIWKFDRNGCSGVKSTILNYVFCNNFCSSHPFFLKFGMGKFFGVRNPKITLKRLKDKPVLRHLRFQVLSICDRTGAEKYRWPNRYLKKTFFFFFYRYQPTVEPKWLLVLF